MAEKRRPHVWVLGSSYIHRLQSHLRDYHVDRNLGLRCRITWDGRGGRLWNDLLPALRALRAKYPDPDILVVHLGGNSLCQGGSNRIRFLVEMKADLAEVFRMLPRTRVLFSAILTRQNWMCQNGRKAYPIERCRQWLNGAVSGFLSDRGMSCIHHPNLDRSHIIRDGVHLSLDGNTLFRSNLREALRVEL